MNRNAAPTALASQHLRLFALLVDFLLAVVGMNLIDKLLLGAAWDLQPLDSVGSGSAWLLGAAVLLLLRDLPPGGRSPGKWFMGIAVARADDPAAAPGLAARILRNGPLLLLPLEAVLVFTDRYCRRLGDRLAGTVVVVSARPAPALRRLTGMAILFLGTLLAISLAEYWNVRRSAAYPVALQAAAVHPQVQSELAGTVHFSAPGLAFDADGRTLRVRLNAEGDNGQGRVEVTLRRTDLPPGWRVETVTVEGPPSRKPIIRDAPPR